MATYDKILDNENSRVYFKLEERHIYGSSRVGVRSSDLDLLPLPTQNYSMKSVHYSIGSRTYELSNHLGNVLSVISDKVIPYFEGGGIAEMRADIRVAQDYSPFGVTLDGRNFVVDEKYRYGFQGQEGDDEIKGDGNSVNYKYRMHDPRIGRFFAVDPLTSKYHWYTPYQFSGNKVIAFRELEGLEEIGATIPKGKPNEGQPVHQQGYNINIGGASGTNVPVYQRGEGGSLAIDQQGLSALGSAGYQINPVRQGAGSNQYGSTQMSTDPSQSMYLMVGGTTVTSDAPLKNQFSMVEIVPPQQVQVGQNVQPVVTSGQTGIFTSGNTLTGPNSAIPVADAVSTIAPSVSTEINNLINTAPAGTTRVVNSTTILVNANIYSTAQMTQMQTMLNPSGQPYTVSVVPSTNLPASTYFTGGTATFTDTRNVITPVMTPTTTGVTITDLIQR